ncbi:hypothetical protein [Oerskovia flava]|uniref:hypothetical protein n=1 Tax=Oerskovia flava TaxID=2986422 RepID=UPI00223FD17A|nr:hypothetical protein [Oerskovia sp. JB1-3-2]
MDRTATPAPPARRSAGVVHRADDAPGTVARLAPHPRYPAMFHTAGGRLVWDGQAFHVLAADQQIALPGSRLEVTVRPDPSTGVRVRLGRDRSRPAPPGPAASGPATSGPAVRSASAGVVEVVVLPASAERFLRLVRALSAVPGSSVRLVDQRVPSRRVPRLSPGAAGSEQRPGVFARAVWRVRRAGGARETAAAAESADVVTSLERLVALHERGYLSAREFALAKERVLTSG